jgi:prolyl-tRNA synthetase
VKGFAPELAVVTHGGGEKLEEPLAVRPTSETIMYQAYAKWIQSWRDLPLMMNQWNNVVRWEKRTLPFLRTSEFLWQEGHTAHATHDDARATQEWAMDLYARIYREYFAIDGYVGQKSQNERFSGADDTLTFEALMPSGKALQACTSHDLGQNFSKAFEIKFQTQDKTEECVWQTSWGFSTRSLGGLIMAHGDDDGLILPPKMAPLQVVVITVQMGEAEVAYARELVAALSKAGIRAKFDDRDDERFGFKLNKWEVKGVPILFKIGGKEVEANQITAQARFDKSEKTIAKDAAVAEVTAWLDGIQEQMLKASREHLAAETREAKDYDEFKKIIAEHKGFVKVYWNDNPENEDKIKEETKATSRCRISSGESEGADFYTGEKSGDVWLFAQSY